jgi:hypothetical protein
MINIRLFEIIELKDISFIIASGGIREKRTKSYISTPKHMRKI